MDHDSGGDTVYEVTSQSWGQRITASLKGILFGLLLLIAATVLLTWNEGRAVDRSRALAAGAAAVVTVKADRVDPANDGRLLHVIGPATTGERLADPDFGITATALKLVRTVEMYQWQEHTTSTTQDKPGGGSETVTTYEYRKDWDTRLADSDHFRHPAGHANPPAMPFHSQTLQAEHVTLGAFRLSGGLVEQMDQRQPLPLQATGQAVPAGIGGRPVLARDNELYLGRDPSRPQVGDLRVRFEVVAPAIVSIVSQQSGDSFVPFATPTGEVELIAYGQHAAATMFRTAERENTLLTWGLRLAGVAMMFLGLLLLLGPLTALATVLPLLGHMVGLGVGLMAGAAALALSLTVIALAWIAQRPVLGIGLLVAGVAALILPAFLRKRAARKPYAQRT